MQTKPKSNSKITHEVEGEVILFKVKEAGDIMLDMSKLSPEVKAKALIHGLIQRVSDRAAILRDPKHGTTASPLVKFEAMKELVDWYETGTVEWAMTRKGGAVGPSLETQFLITALGEVYPAKTQDELTEWVGKRSKEDRLALAQSEKLKVIIDRLRAEATVSVDSEALLSELGE